MKLMNNVSKEEKKLIRTILVYESIIRHPREMSRGKQEKICISIGWGKRKIKNKCLQYKNRR